MKSALGLEGPLMAQLGQQRKVLLMQETEAGGDGRHGSRIFSRGKVMKSQDFGLEPS